jgi:hypothetical protein
VTHGSGPTLWTLRPHGCPDLMSLLEPYSARETARQRLAVLAHGIADPGEDDAVGRLLERVAVSGDLALRDFLLEVGARTVIREVRP